MEKKKKTAGIIITVAVMLPIMGRMISRWQMQSERAERERVSEIIGDPGKYSTQQKEKSDSILKLQASYSLYRTYLEPYTIDLDDRTDVKLLDESGDAVIHSITSLQNLYAPYSLISTSEGKYLLDSEKKEINLVYHGQEITVITENGNESAFIFKVSEKDRNWKLQTGDRLYDNIMIEENDISQDMELDVTGNIPRIIE